MPIYSRITNGVRVYFPLKALELALKSHCSLIQKLRFVFALASK